MANHRFLIVLGLLTVLFGGFFVAVRSGVRLDRIKLDDFLPPDEHRVTEAMLARSCELDEKPAPAFEAKGTDGRMHAIEDLAGSRPLVLVFIKKGCPCSTSAQIYFNRIADAYRGRAHVVGVIDAELAPAQKWARANGVRHLLLLDPSLTIVRKFGVESSVYVALIDQEGTIEKFWPGYSRGMLDELNGRLARRVGNAPPALKSASAPRELLTGCPFDL
jgi:peroxiredoxin